MILKRGFKMKKSTKKYLFICIIVNIFFVCSLALAQDDNGGEGMDAPVGSLGNGGGAALCTAAINSDGTVAGGRYVNKNAAETRRLGPGNYEVDFFAPCNNITAARGYMRYVQVDTLQVSTTPAVFCTTADRAGDPSSIWLLCYDFNGVPTDVSFFLVITR